jgi:hypothetical protein
VLWRAQANDWEVPMSRTLIRAELLIDSWRDQPQRLEFKDRGSSGGEASINRSHDTSDGHIVLDDGPSVPSLVGLIPLGAMKWESR